MEEENLEVIEFKDSFTVDWLNEKLRSAGIYGGVRDNLIELRSGGYILPTPVSNLLEPYLMYIYDKETGGGQIESSQEVYNMKRLGNTMVLEAVCQAMYKPVQAEQDMDAQRAVAVTN